MRSSLWLLTLSLDRNSKLHACAITMWHVMKCGMKRQMWFVKLFAVTAQVKLVAIDLL